MKKILIFAGTTEGRELSECLSASGISHTMCVATEYGEIVLTEDPHCTVRQGRMDKDEMKDFISEEGFDIVVDATHPYAAEVTENIRAAVSRGNAEYLRLIREQGALADDRCDIAFFDTAEECAAALNETEGNILLTTGSKELSTFCTSEEIRQRIFARVLPSEAGIRACTDAGINGKQIIAMQGPFSTEINEAIIRQFDIKVLVTKETGSAGGYQEKITAAQNTGTKVFVIRRPSEEQGYTFTEICKTLSGMTGTDISCDTRFNIVLAGIGMGSAGTMTLDVKEQIGKADIILGAERMISGFSPSYEKKPYYLSSQIIPYLEGLKDRLPGKKDVNVVVLFSGDSGFYSGCRKLYTDLKDAINGGKLKGTVRVMPGISSVAYLASCLGDSYQDAQILSIHGKELDNLARRIAGAGRTYMLVSGPEDINRIGSVLTEAGFKDITVTVGRQLSYPDEQIREMTPEECLEINEPGLYTCFIQNKNPDQKILTPYRSDDEFIRDKVPMTKEEIRGLSILKLKLKKDSVVYDIGSGTGSVAVEIAGLSDDIRVYAIEQHPEAAELIGKNARKFGLENISVTVAKAPEGLKDLPPATHAFIGGSGGNLAEILRTLREINPRMRVVINAITLETISEARDALAEMNIANEDIVQIQVSRSKKAGRYHMMQSENPVCVFAFDFCIPDTEQDI